MGERFQRHVLSGKILKSVPWKVRNAFYLVRNKLYKVPRKANAKTIRSTNDKTQSESRILVTAVQVCSISERKNC